jgi:FixJ family two-component response regulator
LEFGMPDRCLIAIVDDDEPFRTALQALLRSSRFNNVSFASAEQFLSSPHARRTACVIADMNMPGMTGLQLHERLVASDRKVPVILITAYPDDSVRRNALGAGVVCYLIKPFAANDLFACLRQALRPRRSGASDTTA